MSTGTPTLGALNQRVELLRRTTASDESGGQETSYTSLGTVWAMVRAGSGGVQTVADTNALAQTTLVTIRFRADLVPGDRLIIEGEQFDIQSIADINGRKVYQELLCTSHAVIGSRHE